MEKKWFETWFNTKYYHILYNHRSESEAASFVERLMEFFDLPQKSKIMDLACGKGRHAAKMAELGYEVLGTDLAANSIREAQLNYNHDNLSFKVHNMLEPWSGQKFDLVTNLFTSFGYFDHTSQNIQVFKNIHDMLVPGGQFVIDFLNAEKVKNTLIAKENIEKEGLVFHIRRRVEEGKILKNISFEDNGKEYEFQEEVQALTLDDFEEMADKSQLKITEVKGDYSLNDFDEATSPRLILIGKRN